MPLSQQDAFEDKLQIEYYLADVNVSMPLSQQDAFEASNAAADALGLNSSQCRFHSRMLLKYARSIQILCRNVVSMPLSQQDAFEEMKDFIIWEKGANVSMPLSQQDAFEVSQW